MREEISLKSVFSAIGAQEEEKDIERSVRARNGADPDTHVFPVLIGIKELDERLKENFRAFIAIEQCLQQEKEEEALVADPSFPLLPFSRNGRVMEDD